eukprot:GHVP01061656.1.p1 GENE.GHVP01061656.1~~GHVP01061656.1.p1  ORF type:complete len:104 (+),score=14.51 GHVP01061656.1:9-320(+)
MILISLFILLQQVCMKKSQYIITFYPSTIKGLKNGEIKEQMDNTIKWIENNNGKVIDIMNESYIKMLLVEYSDKIYNIENDEVLYKYIQSIEENIVNDSNDDL